MVSFVFSIVKWGISWRNGEKMRKGMICVFQNVLSRSFHDWRSTKAIYMEKEKTTRTCVDGFLKLPWLESDGT